MPDEESVKLRKTREGDNGMRTEQDGAVVFARPTKFVGESEDDDKALLKADNKGFCST